jgi:nucleotide-binding universal stress UspA family protein
LGAVLVLLNVVPPRDRDRLLKARTRLERLVKDLKSNAVAGCHVLAGKPDEQIAAMAADAGVDLVILTRRRGKGFFGARLGSISYRVLCDADVPVLALPSTGVWRRRQIGT